MDGQVKRAAAPLPYAAIALLIGALLAAFGMASEDPNGSLPMAARMLGGLVIWVGIGLLVYGLWRLARALRA